MPNHETPLPLGRRNRLDGTAVNNVVPPLVFVYTGNPLPKYARYNLLLAMRRYRGPVVLLTDFPTNIPGVQVIDLEPWYDASSFQRFCAASELDPQFRGGFWLRAAERFFVLEQFMEQFSFERIFQAECDVLVVDLDGYSNLLDTFGQGIFAPLETPNQAVASLLYVNHLEALKALTAFTIEHAYLGNEMKILGAFIARNPGMAFGLPSNHVFSQDKWPLLPNTVPAEYGLVDASFFGMWLTGIDPKNTEGSVWNRYVPGLTTHELKSFRMHYSLGKKLLASTQELGLFSVRAVHIHSKVFGLVRVPFALPTLVLLSNMPWRTPIIIKWSGSLFWLAKLLISQPVVEAVGKFPYGIRRKLADLFRRLVDRSERRPSNRQLATLCALLRKPDTDRNEVLNTYFPRGLMSPMFDRGELQSNSGPKNQVREEEQVFSVIRVKNNLTRGNQSNRSRVVNAKAIVEKHLNNPSLDSSVGPDTDLWLDLALALLLFEAEESVAIWFQPKRILYLGSDPGLSKGRQALYLWPEKKDDESRLAREFWGPQRVSDKWSFDHNLQVFRPEWVREMFDNSIEEIFRWASFHNPQHGRRLSLVQSYGSWLIANKTKEIHFEAPLD